MPEAPPTQYLGFAWDIYLNDWVPGGFMDGLWFPFPPGASSGAIPLGASGGYHAWISNQYANGNWLPTETPWTGIIFSGAPHQLQNVSAALVLFPEKLSCSRHTIPREKHTDHANTFLKPALAEASGGQGAGAGQWVQLNWDPEIFGAWMVQITCWDNGAGEFIATQGPGGLSVWHLIDFGGTTFDPALADFFAGTADFTLPAGEYLFFIRALAWLPPFPESDYSFAAVSVPQ